MSDFFLASIYQNILDVERAYMEEREREKAGERERGAEERERERER